MIIQRKLTEEEFNRLLKEAPNNETRNLKKILGNNAYDYFEKYAIDSFGLISDDKPIYFGALDKDKSIWTIVNNNVKEQFSLFKYSKKRIRECCDKYGDIYATMEKNNLKNMRWVERLGFKKTFEDKNIVTYIIRRQNEMAMA